MHPKTPPRLLAASFILCLITGCGRGGPAPEQPAQGGASGSGAAAPAAAPADPGRAVRGNRELVGSWYSAEGKGLTGLEFTDSGKLIATAASGDPLRLGPAQTWEYELLDRGRLRVSTPDGETLIFTTGVSGGVLTLSPEASPTETARFRRLERQSVAEAHRADAERLVERHRAMLGAVEELLKQERLVLLAGDPQNAGTREALRLTGAGASAYFDGDPPLRRAAQVALVEDAPGRPIRVQVVIGEVLGPPGAPPAAQPRTEVFTAEGEPGSLRLVNQNRRIAQDAAAHDEVVGRYERVRAEREAAIAAFVEPLGAKAILAVERSGAAGAAPEKLRLTLERIGQSPSFNATLTDGAGRAQPAQAGATWGTGEKAPVLLLRLASGGEMWTLRAGGTSQSLAGRWQRSGAGGEATLTLERSWTAEQLAALRQAMDRFLSTDLQSPLEFAGFVSGKIANAEGQWPVWLRLQRSGDAVAGQAWLHALDGGVEVSGAISGQTITLNATKTLPGANAAFRSYGMQRWQLRLDDMDPQPLFAGDLTMPSGGSGTLELTPAGAERNAAMRTAVLSTLKDAAFEVRSSRHTSPRNPTFIRFTTDDAGRITGELTGEQLDGMYPPALISGELREDRGHLVADLAFATCDSHTRGGRAGHQAQFFLVPRVADGVLTFRGRTTDQIFGHFTLSPAQGSIPEPSAEQRIRLAAQRAGAVNQIPQAPAVGDTILMLVQGTTRGQIFFGDGRYRAVNPQVAAVHAGVIADGELAILRVTFAPPHDKAHPVDSSNGVTTAAIAMNRTTQQSLTMTLEKVEAP